VRKYCGDYAEDSFLKLEKGMTMITNEFLEPKTVSDLDVTGINALLPQLTTSPQPLIRRHLEGISARSLLLVARDNDDFNRIKGMATLVPFRIPTGTIGLIEDVVVDASLCGHGVGTALVMRLIAEARARGVKKLELTSNPARVAANRLYQKLGFELRETNHYRMLL
jgi:GNAT superfamily N-acetyltransferase